ncbi:MAG: DUF58 domain-containing protein [Planctomycetaceae bacterium]
MNSTDHGASSQQREPRFPISFSASSVTQLLAAVACFLGAFVLPNNYPELGNTTQMILIAAGSVSLVLGLGNILLGRFLARMFVKFGMRSRVVIPREGMVYLGIMLMLAIGALLGHQNTLLLVFGLMAGPFVLNGWAVYAMLKGVTVRRTAPRRASAGEFVTVDVTVANSKRWLSSRLLEIRDAVSGDAIRRERRHFEGVVTFVRVPPAGERTGRYQLCFQRRGSYRLGPLRASSRFPLGIGERGHTFSDYIDLLVWPRLGRLHPKWKRQQRELAEAANNNHSRIGLFDDEFHRIREYRVDDNPRAIHWRSTAKRGEPMVREFEQNRQSDLFIMLDLCEQKNFTETARETAISLAATICVEQARGVSGGQYLLGIAGKKTTVVTGRIAGPFRESALDALATCQSAKRSPLDDLISQVIASGMAGTARSVLITPRPEYARLIIPELSAALLPDGIDLLSRTTIVDATSADLSDVFELSGSGADAGNHQSRGIRSNGGPSGNGAAASRRHGQVSGVNS